MKEQYFTPESIHTLSSQWLNEYARPKRLKSQPFDVNRAALLVLDMQNYFLNPDSHAYIPSATAILPGINQAISFFRTNQRPIIATKHVNSKNDAGMMAAWWSEIMTENHQLIGLHPDLDLKEETSPVESMNEFAARHRQLYSSILRTGNCVALDGPIANTALYYSR